MTYPSLSVGRVTKTNVFSSIMENFDTAREALETSENSAGSAMKEHAKWSESLEARLNKLQATWQSLSQSFLSSDFLKVCFDIVTKLVDVIDKLIDKIGVIPTLLGAIGIVKVAKDLLLFKNDITSVGKAIEVLGASFPKLANIFTSFFSTIANGGNILGALKASMSSLIGVIAAHPILAAVAAAGIAITIFSQLHESAAELAEKVDEVTTKYEEQHGELIKLKGDYDSSNEDSMVSKYGELSKGVNALGENVSLTADEYAEYRDIVSTIASQIPGLVTGYNSQGDAILGCAGSVDKLTEAYKNLIIEQDNDILDSGKDIFKDFKNDIKDVSREGMVSSTRHLDELDEILKSYKTIDEAGKESFSNLEDWASNISYDDVNKISDLLEDNGFERDVLFSGEKGWENKREFITRAIKEDAAKVKEVLGDAYDEINSYTEELNTFSSAYLEKGILTKYSDMSDRMQGAISQIASNFDVNFYEQFDNIGELEKNLDSMLSTFANLSTTQKTKFEAAFDLETQFNGGEISYGEYVKGIQNAENLIDSLELDDEVKNQIKLALNTDEVKKNYEALKKRLTSDEYNIKMNTKEAEEFLNGLSASEYSVAVDLIANGDIDFSDFDAKSLKEYIEKEAKLQDALNFTISMDVETESVEKLNTAMAESVSGAGLSSEAISALKARYSELTSQGYDLSAMFEETANGIHLNRGAVSEFEQALAQQKLSETKGNLETLKGTYDELGEKIRNCNDAEERASLYTQQQEIAQKINDLATLASQYEGLASAYNAWTAAEEAGSERDMYENIISGFETIKDEISRGWIDDGSIKFLELLTGRTDLATLSAKELKQVYKDLDKNIKNTGYSIRDFFTVDKDGNSTSTGVYNFLNAVETLEKSDAFKKIDGIENLVKRDKDKNIIGFDFNVVGGDKAVADALGISEEIVQIMQRAADDAGFVVTLDGKWTLLADLKDSAASANDTLLKLKNGGLKELKDFSKEDLTFNFNANNLEDLNTELGKSIDVLNKFKDRRGKLKKDENGNLIKGAQEALDIAMYFQATVDKLTEPVYMQLETNQVEKNLQEPLTKMQEFEKLTKEKHMLNLQGDTTKIKDVEAEMTAIAEDLKELDTDTKIDLGIDGLDTDEIKAKLERGDIEIPATVDIQLEMSDDIKDIKLLMMNMTGNATDEEIKLKLDYEIDDSVVDKLSQDKKEIVVDFITKNKDWFDALSDKKKEIVVELIAKNKDLLNNLSNDKKEIVLDFVEKNEDWFNKLSDKEQEVAIEFVAENKDWFNKLSDGKQKIAIEFIAKNKEWFDELSDGKQEVVIDFVTKNKDWFNKLTDKEQKIALELVVKNKDWFDKLSDDKKKVAIEFVAENKDWFDKLSEKKQQVVLDFVVKHEKWLDELSDEKKQIAVELVADGVDLDSLSDKKKKVVLEYVEENKDVFDKLSEDEKKVVVKYVAEGEDFSKLTKDEQKVIVKLIGDDSEIKNWSPEEKEAMVKYIVNGGDVEGWTAPQKRAWAQYLVDHGDIDGWTPPMKQAWAQYLVDGGSVEGWTPEMKQAYAKYVVDGGDVSAYTPEEKRAFAKYLADGGDPAKYQPPDKTATAKYKKDSSEPDNYQPKDKTAKVTFWATIRKKASDLWSKLTGGGGVDGTAHVDGTAFVNGTTNKSTIRKSGKAFKQGDWGTKDSGVALGGEEAPELLVRNGRWHLIGEDGAEFFGYKRGDINKIVSIYSDIYEKFI